MNKVIIILMLFSVGCSFKSNIEHCNSELQNFSKDEFCIKVSSVGIQNHISFIKGIDKDGITRASYTVMLRPSPYENLKVGDLYLKNNSSDYYCFVRKDSCFLGKFECNANYYNNTLTKYKLDFKYKFGDDFIVDSTGLHLK
jgi:hypothetical protein